MKQLHHGTILVTNDASPTHIQLIEARQVVDGVADNFAKDRVLAIQPLTLVQRDEELAEVCVWLVLVCTCHDASVFAGAMWGSHVSVV